ncbi:MAG: insulinase family protein [Hyphomicrobiaceae bacterium]|nr:insulinase family protein [Hyphomicrobiaceae bacterium]
MTLEISTLSNGLRIVTHAMDHLETVSLGMWVATGARHETESENGISHLLEHMAFKGTGKRSAKQIAEEIETVGGELNAATSLETTAYYARVLKGDETVALDVLADILQNSVFDPAELDREREVILQEIAATRDSPEEIAYDLLQEAAFPDQAVGRNILGTVQSVKGFDGAALKDFMARWYTPERMVFAAAGAVNHERLVRHVEAQFGALARKPDVATAPARYLGGSKIWSRRFEQTHVLLGFEGPSYFADDFFAAQVFSGLFGGGMSSRLFQEARERRGLCYSIYSSAWSLADVGLFSIHAATGREMITELSDVVIDQLHAIAREGPNAAEVQRSKAQLKAGLLMGLESASARTEQMARHLLSHGRVIPSEELRANVDNVTADDIQAFARRLVAGTPSVTVVGAGRGTDTHATHLAGAFGHAA